MERRELLKYGATGIAGFSLGYLVINQGVQTANASLTMGSLSIADASKTTKDGKISNLKVSVQGNWEYDLPSGKNPHRWQIQLKAIQDGTVVTVSRTSESAKYLAFSGSYDISGSLTETNLYNPSDFRANSDGASNQTDLQFKLVFSVVNSEGAELARASLTENVTVTVRNAEYQASRHGSASGNGEITIIE